MTTKVKRVSRQRDWSAELDEDDIKQDCKAPGNKVNDSPMIWVEETCDIGRYWHYVEPTE